jgi:hypothetical protein
MYYLSIYWDRIQCEPVARFYRCCSFQLQTNSKNVGFTYCSEKNHFYF